MNEKNKVKNKSKVDERKISDAAADETPLAWRSPPTYPKHSTAQKLTERLRERKS